MKLLFIIIEQTTKEKKNIKMHYASINFDNITKKGKINNNTWKITKMSKKTTLDDLEIMYA